MAEDNVFRFEMSGRGYELDTSEDKLMGDEVVLIEEVTGGSVLDWIRRMNNLEPTGRDILLVAFLAEYRRTPTLIWREFIRTVAPYSIKAFGPAEETKASGTRKRAASTSSSS